MKHIVSKHFPSKQYVTLCTALVMFQFFSLSGRPSNNNSFWASNRQINVATIIPTQDLVGKKYTEHQLISAVAQRAMPTTATLEINNALFAVHHGVKLPYCKTVYLISRGYMRASNPGENDNYISHGGGLKTAYDLIRDGIVAGAPCVTFDYPDNRAHYSFGQEIDMHCILYVYNQILQQQPNVNIVLIGDCRGSKCALEFLTKKPTNIGAVILFSPFTNVWDLTHQIAKHYVGWLPKSDIIIYHFFNYYYPQYNPDKDDLCTRLHQIDPAVPFFIAHRIFDTVISTPSVNHLISQLTQNGNPVQVLFSPDRTFKHSRMSGIREVQEQVGLFLLRQGP